MLANSQDKAVVKCYTVVFGSPRLILWGTKVAVSADDTTAKRPFLTVSTAVHEFSTVVLVNTLVPLNFFTFYLADYFAELASGKESFLVL